MKKKRRARARQTQTIITISSGCAHCLLRKQGALHLLCAHPDSLGEEVGNWVWPPDFCPLRKKAVLIRIDGRAIRSKKGQ